MRISAGKYRGRVLKSLRGMELRPTSGRLRETLFDVLGDSIQGTIFVDAYAGTGAVGLEALSRGASQVYMLEEHVAAARVLRKNIALLGAESETTILRDTVQHGLRQLERQKVQADIFFLDPPYEQHARAVRVIEWLSKNQLMAPNGLIVLQHSKIEASEPLIGNWQRTRLLTQGSNALSFYRLVQTNNREVKENQI